MHASYLSICIGNLVVECSIVAVVSVAVGGIVAGAVAGRCAGSVALLYPTIAIQILKHGRIQPVGIFVRTPELVSGNTNKKKQNT